jgi:hypothetical protein
MRFRLIACMFSVMLTTSVVGMASVGMAAIRDGVKCQELQKIAGQVIVIQKVCPKTKDYSGNGSVENRSKSKTVSHGPKLKYSVKYFSECTPIMTMRLGCDAIAEPTCADGGWRTFRVVRATNGPRAGQIIAVSTYCSTEPPMDVPGAEQDIARVSLEQFRKLPILASSIVSQPEGFSLRNGHAHLFASSEKQNFSIELFDQSVHVRAIPVTYLWSYGDGTSRTLNFPGSSAPNRGFDEATTTSHVYRETGDFAVGLSTRFRGEYSTEGGPWTPIPGVANVPSEQVTMSVWRTKKILVAENCNQGSSGPGCTSLFSD